MKLSDLDEGELFQFARNQRTANIYMTIRPIAGIYRIVGKYSHGEPLPFCSFSDCTEHGWTVKKERHDRAVRRRSIPSDGPLYAWLTGETKYVTHSVGLHHKVRP